jgi:hypothetical protein
MGDESGSYSPSQRRQAIVLSAILGWAGIVGRELTVSELIFGPPISILLCWLIGGPILGKLMQRPVSWVGAAIAGARAAATMAVLFAAAGWVLGLGSNGQLGYGDLTLSVNGVPTLYGWLLLAQNTAFLVALGAGVGLAARAAIGPGIPVA